MNSRQQALLAMVAYGFLAFSCLQAFGDIGTPGRGVDGIGVPSVASGSGDVVGPASSVDSQVVLFNLTTGKLIKVASGTGYGYVTSGVFSVKSGTSAQYLRADGTVSTLDTSAVTEGSNLYFTNARAIAATLTGYASGAGAVASSDTVLQAIQKLNGNVALKADTSGFIEDIHGLIATAADSTYPIIAKNRVARQVTKFAAKCGAGSITAKLQIGGVDITTCAAMGITTTVSDTTCDTGVSNNLAAGGRLTLVTSINAACTNLEWSIETTRD